MPERKILIVSGEPALLTLLRENLPTGSYQLTDTDDSGDKLRAVVDKLLPDLIILDIMMPQLDGIEVCLRLRQWAQMPIIMLTTWGARKDMVRGLDLSADSYLTDPFGIDELIVRIEEAIAQNDTSGRLSSHLTEHDEHGKLRTGFFCS